MFESRVNIWMPKNSSTYKPAAKDFHFHLFKEKEVLEFGKQKPLKLVIPSLTKEEAVLTS